MSHPMANLPSRLCHAAAHGKPPDFSGMCHGASKADDRSDACYSKDVAASIRMVHVVRI
jgi:hypothetical protein